MQYVYIGLVVLIIVAVAVAYFKGASSGKTKEQNKTLIKIDAIQDKQAKIMAERRTSEDVRNRLRAGTF